MKLKCIEFEDKIFEVGFHGILSIDVSQDGYVLIDRDDGIEVRNFHDAVEWFHA